MVAPHDPNAVNLVLKQATDAIAAIAALGTAAFGMVDATKTLPKALNVSYRGTGTILAALAPFAPALQQVLGVNWKGAIVGPWINGVAKDDQKNTTKGLIRLGLTDASADAVAKAANVDPAMLKDAIKALQTGAGLSTEEINELGRLDATVDAILSAAYERADQEYRNTCKVVAGFMAIALALGADTVLDRASQGVNFGLAILVGIVSVPLAPMAKDLTSALQTAVKSLGSV
ncbi:MAG TPA: hypothetical protein VG387_19460 [Rhizomicrobium sp.]|jgi:hypothetical protein|nr:hypothetical protein [Rhizomicrobium sp.]